MFSKFLATKPTERIDFFKNFLAWPHCKQISDKKDQTLHGLTNSYKFIDETQVITKSTKAEVLEKV